MEKYELTNEDIIFVDKLIQNVRFVENTYVEICEAEVSHEKDEYILSHIYEPFNYALNEEKKIMSYLEDGDSRINAIIEYISEKYDYDDSPLDDVCVSTIDTSNRSIKRALALINDKRVTYGIKESNNVVEQTLNNTLILKNSIDMDYYLGYLYFMQDYIDDQMDLTVRRKLIQCKYNLYYLNPSLEKVMLENKFAVSKDLYFGSKIMSDYLGFSDDVYYDILQYERSTSASDNIDNILNFKEEELHKDCVGMLSFSAFVKSAFLMMSNSSISELKENIKNEIDKIPRYYYFKRDLLTEMFDSVNENKAKSMRLSLRENK